MVDANLGDRRVALRGKRRMDRTPVEFSRKSCTRVRLDRVERRRKAQPRIEALGIDGFKLPGPAFPVARAKPVMLAMVIEAL